MLQTVFSWCQKYTSMALAAELGSCKAIILRIGVRSAVTCDLGSCSHVGHMQQLACLEHALEAQAMTVRGFATLGCVNGHSSQLQNA